ncbi:MAG: hypothetical protein IPM82_07365 [Saprospiraceae bacterium]|nr:hypothetical protein [Saprospiraceae bacterium]
MDSTYGVYNMFMPKQRLDPGQEAWMSFTDQFGELHQTIELFVPEEYASWGISDISDYLKVFICTDEFETDVFCQEPLELESKKGVNAVGKFANSGIMTMPDWTVCTLQLDIRRPCASVKVGGEQYAVLPNLRIAPHPLLRAEAMLSSMEDIGRGLPIPKLLKSSSNVLEPMMLARELSQSSGMGVLELRNLSNHDSVTSLEPLVLEMGKNDAGTIVPIGVDISTGLMYPLGFQGEDGKINIDRLPDETPSGNKSLIGSLKIFFMKVLNPITRAYSYPQLAAANFVEGREFSYNLDTVLLKSLVYSAHRIVLFIHGIIGDTREMPKALQLAHGLAENPLASQYDLILTFDYENMETSIEKTAEDLKKCLKNIGLEAGHGKQLDIVAHSMGGLVSRWFIEKMDGDKVVTKLVMFGTPNGGTHWSNVQEMATTLFTYALNGASFLQPWLIPLSMAGRFLKKTQVTMTEMHPEKSTVLRELRKKIEHNVPYYIIAGNTKKIQAPNGLAYEKVWSLLKQRFGYILLDKLVFGERNDIAATVENIFFIHFDENKKIKY